MPVFLKTMQKGLLAQECFAIHFHFDEEIYLFSQNKYFKKKQYIKNPPNLNDLENEFKSDIRKVLTQYKNFVDFNNLQNIDETKQYTIQELLTDKQQFSRNTFVFFLILNQLNDVKQIIFSI